jgi:hypothetical protein
LIQIDCSPAQGGGRILLGFAARKPPHFALSSAAAFCILLQRLLLATITRVFCQDIDELASWLCGEGERHPRADSRRAHGERNSECIPMPAIALVLIKRT